MISSLELSPTPTSHAPLPYLVPISTPYFSFSQPFTRGQNDNPSKSSKAEIATSLLPLPLRAANTASQPVASASLNNHPPKTTIRYSDLLAEKRVGRGAQERGDGGEEFSRLGPRD